MHHICMKLSKITLLGILGSLTLCLWLTSVIILYLVSISDTFLLRFALIALRLQLYNLQECYNFAFHTGVRNQNFAGTVLIVYCIDYQ